MLINVFITFGSFQLQLLKAEVLKKGKQLETAECQVLSSTDVCFVLGLQWVTSKIPVVFPLAFAFENSLPLHVKI